MSNKYPETLIEYNKYFVSRYPNVTDILTSVAKNPTINLMEVFINKLFDCITKEGIIFEHDLNGYQSMINDMEYERNQFFYNLHPKKMIISQKLKQLGIDVFFLKEKIYFIGDTNYTCKHEVTLTEELFETINLDENSLLPTEYVVEFREYQCEEGLKFTMGICLCGKIYIKIL